MVDDRIVKRAFILGAGLGKRLRPLTTALPKPLVPVWNRPLITYAFDHLIAAGAADELVVNSHHAAGAYAQAFPDGRYRGRALHWSHEPELLDTAGGLAQVAPLLTGQPWALVYNGDVLSDLPLSAAIAAHQTRAAEVTLVLRSSGPVRNVGFDPASGRVLDVRGALGVKAPIQAQFTGLYVVSPGFLRRLEPGRIESVATVWQRMLRADAPVHGVLVDQGWWLDLGTTDAYMEAHRLLAGQARACAGGTAAAQGTLFPSYATGLPGGVEAVLGPQVSPQAELADGGIGLDDRTVIAAGARVAAGAVLRQCVVWPGARVPGGVDWRDRVVLPDGTTVQAN